MSKYDKIIEELKKLYNQGVELGLALQKGNAENFQYKYQSWYTKALKAMTVLASDRLADFRRYYEIDPKRKNLGYGTYVIQDYLRNIVPSGIENFDSERQLLLCFFNQLTILNAIIERAETVFFDLETTLFSGLEDDTLLEAKKLSKINLRAAGALIGVIIEMHLQKVAECHEIKIAKTNPTIADLNDPLKNHGIIDTPTWRRISYLADIRNICSHQKKVDPTKEQIDELIRGAEWLVKNIF